MLMLHTLIFVHNKYLVAHTQKIATHTCRGKFKCTQVSILSPMNTQNASEDRHTNWFFFNSHHMSFFKAPNYTSCDINLYVLNPVKTAHSIVRFKCTSLSEKNF